jgi:hypothetical protein
MTLVRGLAGFCKMAAGRKGGLPGWGYCWREGTRSGAARSGRLGRAGCFGRGCWSNGPAGFCREVINFAGEGRESGP